MMENTRIPWRDSSLKLLCKTGVLVVGGGLPGVCAAIASARAGVPTMLVERSAQIGGQAGEINTWGLDGFIDPDGKLLMGGIPFEILQRTLAEGGSDPVLTALSFRTLQEKGIEAAYREIGCKHMPPNMNDSYVNEYAYRYICQQMLEEANVRVMLDTPVIDTLHDGNTVTGVVLQCVYEKFAVLADRIVDCSQNAIVCAHLGHIVAAPLIYTHTHIDLCGIDIQRLMDYIDATPEDEWYLKENLKPAPCSGAIMREQLAEHATLFIHGFGSAIRRAVAEDPEFETFRDIKQLNLLYQGDGMGTPCVPVNQRVNVMDPMEYADSITLARKRQYLFVKLFRRYVPGCEQIRLTNTHVNIPKAHPISMDQSYGFSEYDLTTEEVKTGKTDRTDVIMRLRGHPGRGQYEYGWPLPLACLIPKELDHILVTGKPASAFIHYTITCARVGEAAGTVAAISLRDGTPLRQTSAEHVREEIASIRQDGKNI